MAMRDAFKRLHAQDRLIDFGNACWRIWHGVRQAPAPGQDVHAPWLRRFLAVVLDASLYTLTAFVGYVLITSPLLGQATAHPGAIEQLTAIVAVGLFLVVPGALLSPWLLARHGKRNGQTLGKRLLGIRVVRDDGHEWTFRTALWRQFAMRIAVPLLVAFVLGGIGDGMHNLGLDYVAVFLYALAVLWLFAFGLWPVWGSERRGLHDKWAKSHVRIVRPSPKAGARRRP
jgi:uncharacterized RDD family membrane protein YckC